MKRGGISILFIHSYLRVLSCLLDHFLCLKMCFVMVFENILKRRLCLGKLCNGSRLIRTYTKFCTFENISCFESVWCVFARMFILKVSKQLGTFLPTQKVFLLISLFL